MKRRTIGDKNPRFDCIERECRKTLEYLPARQYTSAALAHAPASKWKLAVSSSQFHNYSRGRESLQSECQK
jgi:hypothetical protein